MSAPQGFNHESSMLPAGGGVIQPMKGGAAAGTTVPITVAPGGGPVLNPLAAPVAPVATSVAAPVAPVATSVAAPVAPVATSVASASAPVAPVAPIAPSDINVEQLVELLIDKLEGKTATISNDIIVVNPADTSQKPDSPELADFLKLLHDLDPESLKKVPSSNITLKMVDSTNVQLTIKIPNKTTGGGMKQLKAPKKLKRTPLSYKKIHHKQHKNPTADEEEDICLTLVR
jgi:hypothetical protein